MLKICLVLIFGSIYQQFAAETATYFYLFFCCEK